MDDPVEDEPRQFPGPRQVARLVLPAFAASAVVIAIGVVLAATHHRTIGIVIVVVGAVGGFAVRAWLMLTNQPGHRPRR